MSNWTHHFSGQVVRLFIVVCWTCNKSLIGPRQRNVDRFKKQIQDIGWRQHEGTWFCPEHSNGVTESLVLEED
jgi:hypothetical protein